MENGINRKVFVTPLGVDHEIFSLTPLPKTTVTTFLNMGKWEVRKGHLELSAAFDKAFEPEDDVLLLLHCHNVCFRDATQARHYNEQWERLFMQSKMGRAGKIKITQGRLPDHQAVTALMAKADCGVFPARAEGWNMEAAEMLSMGRHVILTDYAAHTEFADRANSLLIEVDRLEDAHDGIWFDAEAAEWEGKPGRWAALGDRQMDQLVWHMREVHRKKQQGELAVNVDAANFMRRFTWQNTARTILEGLS